MIKLPKGFVQGNNVDDLIDIFGQAKEFWENTPEGHEQPHFIARTSKEYGSCDHEDLLKRGMTENRFVESLVAYMPDGAFLAGGFVRAICQDEKSEGDVDWFFRDAKAFAETASLYLDPPDGEDGWAYRGYTLVSDVNAWHNAGKEDGKQVRFLQFKHSGNLPSVQLIKLVWFDSPQACIDTFDFTCVQFAMDKTKFYFNPISWLDIARKRIVLHRMQFPASTLRRLVKYAAKGFYACPGALEIIAQETAKVIAAHPELNGGEFVYLD